MAYTKTELEQAFRNADEAGDTKTAEALARELNLLSQTGQTEVNPITEAVDKGTWKHIEDSAKLAVADWFVSATKALGDPVAEIFFPSLSDVEMPADGSKPSLVAPKSEQASAVGIPTNPAQLAGKLLPVLAEDSGFDYWEDRNKALQQRENATRDFAQEYLGYSGTDVAENQWGARLAGTVVRASIADPVGTVMGGKGKMGLLREVLVSAGSSGLGAVSSEFIRDWGEQSGWDQSTIEVLSMLSAMVTSTAAGATTQAALRGAGAGYSKLKQNQRIAEEVDGAANLMANSQVKSAIRSAVAAQPDMDIKIAQAQMLADKVPGLILPTPVVLGDNPVIIKNFESLMMTSPTFRADINKSLADVDSAILKRKEALFGTDTPSQAEARLGAREAQQDVKISNALRRSRAIDSNIERVAERVRVAETPETVGIKTRGLLAAKEKAIYTAASAKYEGVLDKYSAQGLRFPADSVKNIYNTAATMNYQNLFADHPRIVNKINAMYSPDPSAPKGTPPKFRSLNLNQLDSLKRTINEGIRNESSGGKRAELKILKESLKTEIDAMGRFGEEYSGIDTWYVKEIGIPLNEEGIKQLDSTKFAEVVGTRLSRPQTAREFLNFVGDDGMPVLRDSILTRMQDNIFDKVDGTFDTNKYIRFVNANKGVIELVPGLGKELQDIGSTITRLDDTRSRLDVQHTEQAKRLTDSVFSITQKKGLPSVVAEILKSPAGSHKYLRSIKDYTADTAAIARRGVRTGLVDKAMGSGNPLEFIQKNKARFDEWFGAGYVDNLKVIAEIEGMLGIIDPNRIPHAHQVKDHDVVQEYTGNTIPNITSQLRQQIISMHQKIAVLGSRYFNKKTTDSRDAAVEAFMLNPDNVKPLAEMARLRKDNKITRDKFIEGVNGILHFSVQKAQLRGAAGAEVVSKEGMMYDQQQPPVQTPAETPAPEPATALPSMADMLKLNPRLASLLEARN